MKFLLLPFRILLVFLLTAVFGVFALILRLFGFSPQRVVYIVANKCWSHAVLWACGVKVTSSGQEKLDPSTPAIYVANHASLLDIPVIITQLPVPLFFVAKKSLSRVPFLGWYMYATGMIFIDRSNREKAIQSMREAAQLIKHGKNVLSFPEGTRSKTGRIGLFKRGSFVMAKEGGVPVVPVGVQGTDKILASGKWMIHPGRVHLTVGEVITPVEHSDMSAENFAALAESRVRNMVE